MTLKRYNRHARKWARLLRERQKAEAAMAVTAKGPGSKYGRRCDGDGHRKPETFGHNIHRCGSCLNWWTTEFANG